MTPSVKSLSRPSPEDIWGGSTATVSPDLIKPRPNSEALRSVSSWYHTDTLRPSMAFRLMPWLPLSKAVTPVLAAWLMAAITLALRVLASSLKAMSTSILWPLMYKMAVPP